MGVDHVSPFVLIGAPHGADQEARDDSLVLWQRLRLEEMPDLGVGEEPSDFFDRVLFRDDDELFEIAVE